MKTRIELLILLLLFAAQSAIAQIEGYWGGKLNLGISELEMGFDIKAVENGFSVTLDVPAQGAHDIPVDETIFQDNRLQMTMSAMGALYSGVLKGDAIEGEFTQHGMTFPLNLEKGKKDTQQMARPQDPQPPFDYRIKEVSFTNEKEGNTLTGTLTIPEGDGPFPAMVLVSGSGQQNRDEELMNHRPFWVIADYCARHGIAVLRYDDRGIGGSTGEVKNATSLDFSYDAEAAFDYLLEQEYIDASRVGILGHSEGGIINFMVAARRPEVAFLVSLAGPAVNGIEVLKAQQVAILRASGMTEEAIQFSSNANVQMFNVIEASGSREEADTLLRQLVKGWGYGEELTEQTVGELASPWMYYFLKYDPTEAIVKTNCPALLLNGSKDLQVVASQNLPAYEKIIADYGKTNLTLHELPDLNHLFQHCETGSPNEYFTIEETISSEVLEIIVDFVKGVKKMSPNGKFDGRLYPVIENEKVGFIDKDGNMIIEPQFKDFQVDILLYITEGDGYQKDMICVCSLDDQWGYIDMTGKYVIAPQFSHALSFWEGLAAVKTNDKWGFIDSTGQYVIDPIYDEVESFNEGVAQVKINDLYGFIDKKGQFVVAPIYSRSAPYFSEGLAAIRVKDEWGFVDMNGQLVIPQQFVESHPYENLFAGILEYTFKEGLAAVKIDGQYGYIDKTGRIVIEPQYENALPFSEGLAAVYVNDKLGFIDKTGKMVITPQFEYTWMMFKEGLAVVKVDDVYGCIDKQGHYVIKPQFDEMGIGFIGGLCEIVIGDKHGWVDKTGRVVWMPRE